jgi:hypothetical protein
MDYNSKRYKVFGNNIRTGYPKNLLLEQGEGEGDDRYYSRVS